ncbi:hypothetical protein [Methylobacterium sp. W2]|uniref:hypothetical protein n=1 Tax=Methylobacterium sp. W2 TaxID=2598107 RepID=UPI001D0CB5F8|nr:hypothetical protein [Methylobacterium sp. W2]
MRRVLVRVWGKDGNAYAGRRMTLYRDDSVRFGGVDVGGIRISHMSDITGAITMALTDKKGSRKPYRVEPLRDERGPDGGKAPERDPAPDESRPKTGRERLHDAGLKAATLGSASLRDFRDGLTVQQDAALAPILPELDRTASDADDRDGLGFPVDHNDAFPGDPDDSFPGDRSEAA